MSGNNSFDKGPNEPAQNFKENSSGISQIPSIHQNRYSQMQNPLHFQFSHQNVNFGALQQPSGENPNAREQRKSNASDEQGQFSRDQNPSVAFSNNSSNYGVANPNFGNVKPTYIGAPQEDPKLFDKVFENTQNANKFKKKPDPKVYDGLDPSQPKGMQAPSLRYHADSGKPISRSPGSDSIVDNSVEYRSGERRKIFSDEPRLQPQSGPGLVSRPTSNQSFQSNPSQLMQEMSQGSPLSLQNSSTNKSFNYNDLTLTKTAQQNPDHSVQISTSISGAPSNQSQRESKYPIPGDEPEGFKALLTDPQLLIKHMHSVSEKVFKDLMVKELKDVKQNIFDFVNTISTDMKLKLEQNRDKLSEAMITISGLAETVVEMQISSNGFREKMRVHEQTISENSEFKNLLGNDPGKICKAVKFWEDSENGKLQDRVDCKKIYERIDLVHGELEGKIYEIVTLELEKEKDFYGNTRKSSGDMREDIAEDIRLELGELKRNMEDVKRSFVSLNNKQFMGQDETDATIDGLRKQILEMKDESDSLIENSETESRAMAERFTVMREEQDKKFGEMSELVRVIGVGAKSQSGVSEEVINELGSKLVFTHKELEKLKTIEIDTITKNQNIIWNKLMAINDNLDECQNKTEITSYDIGLLKKDIVKHNKDVHGELNSKLQRIESMTSRTLTPH
jgi:hypothetical protein